MPSFELNKLQAMPLQPVSGPKALSSTDRAAPKTALDVRPESTSGPDKSGVSLEIDTVINSAKPPVDNERVAEIRDALRDGRYPLIPAQIADAIIAAQYSFEVE